MSLIRFILHFVVSGAALLVAEKFVTGVHVDGWRAAVMVTLVLLIIKYTIKPILTIISFPINIATLGLFSFVLNGIILFYVAKYVEGFAIDTFVAAIFAGLIISCIKTVAGWVIDAGTKD